MPLLTLSKKNVKTRKLQSRKENLKNFHKNGSLEEKFGYQYIFKKQQSLNNRNKEKVSGARITLIIELQYFSILKYIFFGHFNITEMEIHLTVGSILKSLLARQNCDMVVIY